jgi:L-threonylcarbamoyladenylate synthase
MNVFSNINQISELIKEGKTMLYPTDTIWGLGCDATNEKAVNEIYKIKNRPDSKSMIILVNSDAMLQNYVEDVPPLAWDIIDLSDKPTTIIYPKAKNLPQNLVATDGSIAIRMVKDGFVFQLLNKLRVPIVSTSANISGNASPRNFNDIDERIKEAVDIIVSPDLETSSYHKSSSILKLAMNGEIEIIRK